MWACMHTPLFPTTPSLPFYFFLPFFPYSPSSLYSLPSLPTLLCHSPSVPCYSSSLSIYFLLSLPSVLFLPCSASSLPSPSSLPCSPLSLHYLPSLCCVYAFLHASMCMFWMLVCACLSCDVGQGQSDLPVVPGGNSRELLANMTAHTYSHVRSFTSLLFLSR